MERTENDIFCIYPTENAACWGIESLPPLTSADAGHAIGQRIPFLRFRCAVIGLVPFVLARNLRHVSVTVTRAVGRLYTDYEKTTGKRPDMVATVPGYLLLWIHMHQWILRVVQKRGEVEVVDVAI